MAALIAISAWAASGPAQACSWAQAPETVGDGSAYFLAREMARAATYVDLVLVEDDGIKPQDEAPANLLTLRSVAHLKGDGADRFQIFGRGLTLQQDAERVFAAPLQHFTREDGRVIPFPYSAEYPGRLFSPGRPLPPPVETTASCGAGSVAGQTGRFYVVMRGADGRLLNFVQLYDSNDHPAFAFVPITLDRNAPWLRAVLSAVAASKAPSAPQVLHLKDGIDPAIVEASLKRTGVELVAAYFRSGTFLDEVRPGPSEAGSPWLTRAPPVVLARRQGGLADADHGAAEFLRGKLGQSDGGLGYELAQAYLATVRWKQQSAREAPRLIAIEVVGPTPALAAAARETFAAGWRSLRQLGGVRTLDLPGEDEAARFAAMQAIERDLWLMAGGNGNRPGTLPREDP